MIAPRLLFALDAVARSLILRGIPGAIVECGVWNGGSAALLAAAAREAGSARRVWAFDSFEGLPRPTDRDPEAIRRHYFKGWNRGNPEKVREIWSRLGLPPEDLVIRRGWFHETFPTAPEGPVALLHIDSDWYESVKICLAAWFDRISPGGVVILNDYNLYSGANEALHEFLEERALQVAIHPMGRAGAWFEKP